MYKAEPVELQIPPPKELVYKDRLTDEDLRDAREQLKVRQQKRHDIQVKR